MPASIVVKVSGEDRYLRLDAIEGQLAVATDGQTFGHSVADSAVIVAAVDVRTAGGEGGAFNGGEVVETFSSNGPRRIFFQPDGTPITAGNFSSTGGNVLQKPDLAAADAVSTSTPGFSTFRGTSASAPHAASIVGVDAGGGRRPRACHTSGAPHSDDGDGARYRGTRHRSRFRCRHRDGAGCGGSGGGRGRGPQWGADGGERRLPTGRWRRTPQW